MQLTTSDKNSIKPYLQKLTIPAKNSHKGQNGKLLIIGGSQLFHAASLWAADIASRIVDMVHYSSTIENEEVFIRLKTLFLNGIIVKKEDLTHYVMEDDCILVGPGMVRGESDEARSGRELIHTLIKNNPDKQFVFDAGALQMMDKKWLELLKTKPILTPHALEFATLFGISLEHKTTQEIAEIAQKTAKEYNCILLLKTVVDIVTDGESVVTISGGNAGLTKGGSGDTLAGLCAALCTKNDPMTSAIIASYLLKMSAETLFEVDHYWFNTSDLILQIPKTLKGLVSNLI